MTIRDTTPADDSYALDLTGPVQHVATALGKSAPDARSIDDLAAGYRHFAGDLARVRKHENLTTDSEAIVWLITRAVSEMTLAGSRRGKKQLVVEDGWVSLAPGVTADDLKWRGQTVYSPPDIHKVLGDPFNPMSGRFAGNVRKQTGKDDTSDLEASMRAAGWLPGHPAVKDARTGVTITGHRRLKVAAKLRDEGLDIPDDIQYFNFELDGEGDPADVHRMDTALLSNFGFRQITPEERAETALWLAEKRNMTQQQVAKLLGVSQQTISRDLNKIVTQMGTELEPLIAAATAGIHRGLSQSQIGVEQGLSNNSMVLAKAFAVAVDRIKRESEPTPPSTSAAVQDAIREAEADLAGDAPMTPIEPATGQPYDAKLCEHELGTCPEECDCRCEYCMDQQVMTRPVQLTPSVQPEPPAPEPRPAVNPPSELPPAPQSSDEAFAPQDEAAQAYDQQLDNWSWDAGSQRWIVQRGTALVTCRLPQDTPPAFPAHLFGVQLVQVVA